MALKRPHAISFSKKNTVRPFEDASSLDFWSQKNDASLFIVGQSTKKRPDGLIFVRMYDYRVLDMCEVGVEQWKAMAEFKVRKYPRLAIRRGSDLYSHLVDCQSDTGAQTIASLCFRTF